MQELRILGVLLVVMGAAHSAPVVASDTVRDGIAQSDEDDELSDILGGPDDDDQSAGEEESDLREGRTGDNVGARDEDRVLVAVRGLEQTRETPDRREDFGPKRRPGEYFYKLRVTNCLDGFAGVRTLEATSREAG